MAPWACAGADRFVDRGRLADDDALLEVLGRDTPAVEQRRASSSTIVLRRCPRPPVTPSATRIWSRPTCCFAICAIACCRRSLPAAVASRERRLLGAFTRDRPADADRLRAGGGAGAALPVAGDSPRRRGASARRSLAPHGGAAAGRHRDRPRDAVHRAAIGPASNRCRSILAAVDGGLRDRAGRRHPAPEAGHQAGVADRRRGAAGLFRLPAALARVAAARQRADDGLGGRPDQRVQPARQHGRPVRRASR